MNYTIILSSVRDHRLADSVYKHVTELIGEKFTHTLVDPLKLNLPMLNKRFYEMEKPDETFLHLHDLFMKTDGFLIVTAEYNHSIPPALSNLLDHFGEEFKNKACGIISYSDGAVGGARSAEQLRLLCSTLGMPPIPISPAWGIAHKADEPAGESFKKNFDKVTNIFLDQLQWYTEAFADKRAKK